MTFPRSRDVLLTGTTLTILLSIFAQSARADELWADKVIAFSTQYDVSGNAAIQTLGMPNTLVYGDEATAWTAETKNGTKEFVTVGFATPLRANAVLIRETYGNGFVYQVDLLDTDDVYHPIWSGMDPSVKNTPVDYLINFPMTSYLVKGVKVYVDTDHDLTEWEQIDAIQLRGEPRATNSSPCGSGIGMVAFIPLGLLALRFTTGRSKR